jgi:hypothetical protein
VSPPGRTYGTPVADSRAARRRARTTRRSRRTIAILALAAVLVGALVIGDGLVFRATRPGAAAFHARPVTAAEAARLAGVRLADYTGGHAGIAVTIGTGGSAVHMTGWVDWRQPLIYLNGVGATAGPYDGMVQAIPGVVAVRPGRYQPPAAANRYDPYPAPPVPAPPTGWQVRPVQRGSAMDTMITLLFSMRSSKRDSATAIAAIGTRIVGQDRIGDDAVDVIDGAAVPPTAPTGAAAARPTPSPTGLPFAAYGGQVRYWVDARSRVLRVAALVNPATTLRIDFDRTDATDPTAIELLGGAVVHPTPPSAGDLALLANMRVADHDRGGGVITLAVPAGPQQLYSATGWLDWNTPAAYATIRNNKASTPDALLRADEFGLTVRGSLPGTPGPNPGRALAAPTLRPPTTGWRRTTWASYADRYGEPDLELILDELLTLSATTADDPAALKPVASRLRSDSVDGVPVTVFEIRQASEATVPPGYGRFRFWVDAHGLLRRLELRTRTGAYGYVTITPGSVPALPDL